MPQELVDTQWLNFVIRGKIQFRKCPNCDADGIELQAYNDEGNPCPSEEEDSYREACGDCGGLAFIQIPI